MNQGKELSRVFQRSRFLNIRGQLYDFSQPKIMGILNMTPDSFYKESRIHTEELLIERVASMVTQGCHIIDIGACSTRPDAPAIEAAQEIDRLGSSIQLIKKAFPEILVSLDTYRRTVAQYGIEQGCDLINDISAGQFDADLWPLIARHKIPYVLNYNRAEQQNKAQSHTSQKGIVSDALSFLSEKLAALKDCGITDVLIDPGFGFGKTVDENHQLMQQLEHLQILGYPILVGISRKSMITKKLGISTEDALNGSSILHTTAFLKGATVFRVHDITEIKQLITLLNS